MTQKENTKANYGFIDHFRLGNQGTFNFITCVLAVIAIVVSSLSYCVSERSLDLARDQFQYAIEDRVFVDGEWANASLLLDEFQESSYYKTLDGETLYSGLSAFVRFKLANVSQHPITIAFLKACYALRNGSVSIPHGGTFMRMDTLCPIDLPRSLQPSEQMTAAILVPIPISKDVYSALKNLPKHSMLEKDAIINSLLSYNREHTNIFSQSSSDTSWFATMVSCLYTESSHLPELLLTISEGDMTVRSHERALEIAIQLSSGSIIFDTLDYISINRSAMEF